MERRFLAYFAVAAVVLTGSVFALNVWVDPFARWASPDDGFDREPAYTLNRRIFKLVAFERWMKNRTGLPPSLIVGDSTANQIDAGLLSKLTGHPWYSLAYGGAGLEENAKLLDYVLENYPVRRVVWNVPFTRMVGDVPGDMARSIAMANEPIRHTLTYEALQGSLLVMRQTWLGIRFDDPTLDTGKQDAVTYNLSRTRTELAGRPWPDAELGPSRQDARTRQAEGRRGHLHEPTGASARSRDVRQGFPGPLRPLRGILPNAWRHRPVAAGLRPRLARAAVPRRGPSEAGGQASIDRSAGAGAGEAGRAGRGAVREFRQWRCRGVGAGGDGLAAEAVADRAGVAHRDQGAQEFGDAGGFCALEGLRQGFRQERG